MPKSNLLYRVFSHIPILIELSCFLLLQCIYVKMLIIYNYLFIEIIYLFLFFLGELFDHVISRNENCLEVIGMGKGVTHYLNF